jgi:hypothetical protein
MAEGDRRRWTGRRNQLKTTGIEKGKPFSPDANTPKILNDAVREAHAWLDGKYERIFSPPFNEGSHWALPASQEVAEAMQTQFAKADAYPVDGRGTSYSMAFFSAKHLDAGQYYLMTIVDKEGQPLCGGSTYCLRVPPNAPVTLYWSATIYDRATHGLIRNLSWSSRSSNTPGLQKNADGSVDIYFGTKAPEGKESNWIPSSAGGKFEVLFRFYGPEKALFEKTWTLPDIEQTATAQASKAAVGGYRNKRTTRPAGKGNRQTRGFASLHCRECKTGISHRRFGSPCEILFAEPDVQHSFSRQNIQGQAASPKGDAQQ